MRQISFLNRKFNVEISSDADESVIREIFEDREYLNLEPYLKTAKNSIIDIGAHKGFFVLYARSLNPTVPIYTFEPEEKNFQELKANLMRNGIQNVFSKNSAVSVKEGSVDLYISSDSHNHSLVMAGANKKKVNATTLEKILNKIGQCDVVKMDCEGSEFDIFANLPDTVFAKIPVFFIEYHEYTENMRSSDLKTKLEKNGYKVKVCPSRHNPGMGYMIAHSKKVS
ncbi:MAG: FkbM family methyltransferase [Candidatus Peregrinibacteria bacterium GW2011_GWF2_43_17]|nr:MAG: FkbM family methyltransferase [Candidatus Peregrinibacteria bacterium GW2011_GWF2_43_17]KKT20573.1 MAG: FkbM family methyltransferase [Candidatus Peregrinibacteria bacterium GW2011_GWA2_43_8]HAU39909.1 hypothetical protein [Candidatus Peregrinibacteria bacterium]